MATTTQIDGTTSTDDHLTDNSEAADSHSTTSWTARCGAPATFDPTSGAAMGQFETAAEDRQ